MSLIRWQPNQVSDFRREFDRFFDDFWGLDREADSSLPRLWAPEVEISETHDEVEVSAELPGMKQDDIQVSLSDNVVTIHGEKKQETETKERDMHRMERRYGNFHRSFTLPVEVNADKAEATYRDGVLKLTFPKVEESKAKKIAVKAS